MKTYSVYLKKIFNKINKKTTVEEKGFIENTKTKIAESPEITNDKIFTYILKLTKEIKYT